MEISNRLHKISISFVFDFNPDLINLDMGSYGPVFSGWFPTEYLERKISNTTIRLNFQPQTSATDDASNTLRFAEKLNGSIEIYPINASDLRTYTTDRKIPTYDFAKEVIKKLVQPTIEDIVNILLLKYHQFWITLFSNWDSRKESLTQVCGRLNMRWKVDNDEFVNFVPPGANYSSVGFRVDHDLSQKYITKDDWKSFQDDLSNNVNYGIASQLLTRAHNYNEIDDIRVSFVEGISSLEIALSESIRSKSENYPHLKPYLNHFYDLKTKQKVSYILAFSNVFDSIDIGKIIRCIDIRNQIVHDGYTPNSTEKQYLEELLKIVSIIIPNITDKFPSYPG